MRGRFLMKVRLMTIYNYPNLRNLNHVKKEFLVSFWYETFFAKPCSTTGNTQSDVEFNEESFDGEHVSKLYQIQKLCTKNLRKMIKLTYSLIFETIPIAAECCLGTEKTSKILGIQPTYVTGEVFWLKLNPFNALESLVRTMH